jgi:predicted AAA+ superfamily ATPase
MENYRPRVVDAELAQRMTVMGAVMIDGAKAVGKTATASQMAATTVRLDVDSAARAALKTYPEQLFTHPTPILFDEWQETPEIWNLVRRAVDDRTSNGLYLLTGSSWPRDNARMHSGAGRIGRCRMRPMSLYESGHSSGSISLAGLLQGDEPEGKPAPLGVPDLIERVVVGGWPELLENNESDARVWLTDYMTSLAEIDVPGLGSRRNPTNIRRLLAALGRHVGSSLNQSALAQDVGGHQGPVAYETLSNYLDALERLMLLEPLPAWRPHLRSRTQLRAKSVHHFVDPSLGVAALGGGSSELLADLNAAGFHFESLVLRDLRVYAQQLNATFSSWRDSTTGTEVDAILELPNGRWAGFEIKLGESGADVAARSLLTCARKVDATKHGKPTALVVITGGQYAYRRPDGVCVVPITALGP